MLSSYKYENVYFVNDLLELIIDNEHQFYWKEIKWILINTFPPPPILSFLSMKKKRVCIININLLNNLTVYENPNFFYL